jgi:hypothetical protein
MSGSTRGEWAGISVLALSPTLPWDHDVEQRTDGGRERCEAASQTLKEALNVLAAKIQAVQQQPPLEDAPVLPQCGLNPARCTEALRMHRRGESREQIAAALEIPFAEVDLLLEAHRIVRSYI